MKRQIRRGCFETNSSSVHTLTLCSKEDYKAWENGEKVFDYYAEKIIDAPPLTKQDWAQARESYEKIRAHNLYYSQWDSLTREARTQWAIQYKLKNMCGSDSDKYLTYEQWHDNYASCFETYHQSYKTPKGEEIVAFGCYGHD